MKKFGKYILIILFFYAAGVAASVLLDGTDIATGLTSLWALAAAGMALLCCLLFGKPKKEEKIYPLFSSKSFYSFWSYI